MVNETIQPQQVIFTERAAQKVAELLLEEENLNLNLRVYIEGGGCSGFQYGFTFDEITHEDDLVIDKIVHCTSPKEETLSVRLLIDSISLQYLLGAEIDYSEDLQGARFIIRNPNAATTCGCGSSFSLKD